MWSTVIRGFFPWIIFFAFADGSLLGFEIGIIGGLLFLFLFNRKALYKRFILAWGTLVFFILLPLVAIGFHDSPIIQNSSLWANAALALICFSSLIIFEPITLQYERLTMDSSHRDNPVLLKINRLVTLYFGCAFLLSSTTTGLHGLNIGTKLWMAEILPTLFFLSALAFMIIFPDLYHRRLITRMNDLSRISNISPLQYVHFNNIYIGYHLMGQGPLIVLLQDAYLNMHAWDADFLGQLAKDFQLLIFDYPGIGYSEFTSMSYTTETLAACILAVLDQLNLKPFALLGSGLGGFIAQKFALCYPNHYQALILINTDIGGPTAIPSPIAPKDLSALFLGPENRYEHLMPLFFPSTVLPRLKDKLSKIFLSNALTRRLSERFINSLHQLITDWYQADQSSEHLEHFSSKVLIISGKQDSIIPAKNAHILHHHLKQSSLIEYDDAGHGIIYQYPFDVADHVKTFLTDLT